MKKQTKNRTTEITDGLLLTGRVLFVGWVALTQPAALAAPTTAIFTASLLARREKSEAETIAEQFRPLFVAVGTTLTAFLWLLSTTQPSTDLVPTDAVQTLVILIGWLIAATTMIAGSFTIMVSKVTSTDFEQNRIKHYITGMLFSTFMGLLFWFTLRLSEGITGPLTNQELNGVPLVVVSPMLGWVLVFQERSQKSE